MSETPDIEQRLRAFAARPDEADWDDVLHRAGERALSPLPSVPSRVLAFVAVALAVSLVAITASLGHRTLSAGGVGPVGATGGKGDMGAHGATGADGPTGGDVVRADGRNPWGKNGRQITLDELRAEAPYFPLPSSELANADNVGAVWIWDHASDPEMPVEQIVVAVSYPTSGIVLIWGLVGSPLDYSEDPTEFRTIDGVPSLLQCSMAVSRSDIEWGDCQKGWAAADGTASANGPTGAKGATGSVGATGAGGPISRPALIVPFGPNAELTLQGPSASDLIAVAQTLSPSPGDVSPAGDLPTPVAPDSPSWPWWPEGLLTDVVSLNAVGDAADSLTFQPVAAPTLGKPGSILETDPAQTPPSDRVLSLRYDRAPRQPFWVIERPSLPTTASVLGGIAYDCTPANMCSAGDVAILDLGDGVSALRLWDSDLGKIAWVEDGVYYEVVGAVTPFPDYPGGRAESAFSQAKALSVAKAVAAAAAAG